jgi:hypothetical protein
MRLALRWTQSPFHSRFVDTSLSSTPPHVGIVEAFERITEYRGFDEVLSWKPFAAGLTARLTGMFDVLVVDEASQALTPAILMVLQWLRPNGGKAPSVILAGDHRRATRSSTTPRHTPPLVKPHRFNTLPLGPLT